MTDSLDDRAEFFRDLVPSGRVFLALVNEDGGVQLIERTADGLSFGACWGGMTKEALVFGAGLDQVKP
jgi:hypothetical protein